MMSDELGSRVDRAAERAAAAMERSRQLAGRIGECELQVAATFESLAVRHPDRAAALRAVAAHSREFAETERRRAGVRADPSAAPEATTAGSAPRPTGSGDGRHDQGGD